MAVKIKDLARDLKLSVATISKSLKDSHEISAETKRRVLEHAKKLNYSPNPYASSLRKRSSKTIAVVLPEVADSFFSQAINGIEDVASEMKYHVLIYLTHENFSKEAEILNEFKNGRVDGILISVSGETCQSNHIKEIISAGVPVVFFDRVCDDVDTAKITTNDTESSYNATTHLVEQGCKRIAFLSVSETLSISKRRMEGFNKAMVENKDKNISAEIVQCGNDADKNMVIVSKLLKRKKRPDGIIASVEKLIAPVYQVCNQEKLKIPADIKIISFTNLQTALILNPALTTVTQPAFDMGKTAATVLFKALRKKNSTLKKESAIISSSLIIRNSTKK